MPNMKPVYSSHISHIAYDPLNKTLSVRYSRGNRTAVYKGVPEDIGNSVTQAPSIGEALHSMVRGKFPFTYEKENE